jgi:hypothetical protein
MFSESIQAVVCQTLIPRAVGKGRVCAMEIMTATPAVRALIREAKTHQLPSIIQVSAKYGMQNLDQLLKQLVYDGLISKADAVMRANNKFLFDPAEGGTEMPEDGASAGPRPGGERSPQQQQQQQQQRQQQQQQQTPQQETPQEEDWMKVFGKKR